MATSPNPLQQKPPNGSVNPGAPATMDLLLGGLPAAQTGQQQNALGMMLGPGTNLSPYVQMGGVGYGEQLDDLMMNPMAAWF